MEIISDVNFYDDQKGQYQRRGDRLFFAHTGNGNYLPLGFNYDMSTMVLKYEYQPGSYRPLQGNVKVIGWASTATISKTELIKFVTWIGDEKPYLSGEILAEMANLALNDDAKWIEIAKKYQLK